METFNYQHNHLNFDYIPKFLTENEADAVFLVCNRLPWTERHLKRRANMTYGDEGLVYVVKFRNNVVVRKAISWDRLPILATLKAKVERETGTVYNFCAVMRYPNGDFGIGRHRDKEMIDGTTICGLSVGQERTFILTPPFFEGCDEVSINLQHGSLYAIKPPTNNYWTHEIPKEPRKIGVRYSLTFRNAPENMEELTPIPKPVGNCCAILKSGKRAGQFCGSKIWKDGQTYCGRHKK